MPSPPPEIVSEAALEKALLILAAEHDAPSTVKIALNVGYIERCIILRIRGTNEFVILGLTTFCSFVTITRHRSARANPQIEHGIRVV